MQAKEIRLAFFMSGVMIGDDKRKFGALIVKIPESSYPGSTIIPENAPI